MLKLTTTLIVLLFVLICCGQQRVKNFVKQTAVSISTVEPDSTDFSELEIIGNAIGDSKIVMLGEQDHGDAPAFLAKTRIIKYLHEKKGFNVLAFESDFFGLNHGRDNLARKERLPDSFITKNIFPIWTYCNACSNLFYEYIPATFKTGNPIQITGFDNQMILQYSSKKLVSKLDSVLRALDLPIVKQEDYISKILPAIDSLKYLYSRTSENQDFYSKCDGYLKEIKRQAGVKLGNENFWIMVIDNLIQENKEFGTKDYFQKNNVRDSQMAQNLQWLAKVKYPNEKIIVWAANGHVARYSEVSKNYPYKELISMGSYFTRDSLLHQQSYIIGFTSYEGEAGRLGSKNYTIRKPKPDGFENWIDKSFNYAFVNFKNFTEKSEYFYLKGLSHYSFFKKDWATVFDGIFYIKKMYPCQKSGSGN